MKKEDIERLPPELQRAAELWRQIHDIPLKSMSYMELVSLQSEWELESRAALPLAINWGLQVQEHFAMLENLNRQKQHLLDKWADEGVQDYAFGLENKLSTAEAKLLQMQEERDANAEIAKQNMEAWLVAKRFHTFELGVEREKLSTAEATIATLTQEREAAQEKLAKIRAWSTPGPSRGTMRGIHAICAMEESDNVPKA